MASGAAFPNEGPLLEPAVPVLASRPAPQPGPWRRLAVAIVMGAAGVLAAVALVVAALAGAVIGLLLTIGALAARWTPQSPRRASERAPPGWRLETAPRSSHHQPMAPG